jgi:2-polyprenyl-3-methyl-5-hydroxy-6-metoxy-1,4-benzoquinol methylase
MAVSMNVPPEAINNQKKYYDDRFVAGYMEGFEYDVYERCRLYTVRKTLRMVGSPTRILDYGCGQGRYISELRKLFPQANICGCDISDVGLKIAQSNNLDATLIRMNDETVDCPSKTFDLVISIEVLEHVGDSRKAVKEISRVLKPGGIALITTPCANRYSLEWLRNWMSGGLQPSHDGFGRFATDEPGHLRRLTSNAMNEMFLASGAELRAIYYRSHFFTTLVEQRTIRRLISQPLRARFALLDWHFFKYLPNGATMLALYQKK